jgi:hypothetical protein
VQRKDTCMLLRKLRRGLEKQKLIRGNPQVINARVPILKCSLGGVIL